MQKPLEGAVLPSQQANARKLYSLLWGATCGRTGPCRFPSVNSSSWRHCYYIVDTARQAGRQQSIGRLTQTPYSISQTHISRLRDRDVRLQTRLGSLLSRGGHHVTMASVHGEVLSVGASKIGKQSTVAQTSL